MSSQVSLDKSKSASAPKPSSVWRDLGNLGIKAAAVALVFVLIFTCVYGLQRNIDPGMTPSVKDGDLVMFYRLNKNYEAGDLVSLKYRGQNQVRRVIAKGGDTVNITADGLIVNGALQEEPDIYQKTVRYASGVSFPLTVGKGQVFVLGDARADATDSRVYGPVKDNETFGKVVALIRKRNL